MNPPQCQGEDSINFLSATPRPVSATEAARVQPEREAAPAHDAFRRLLQRVAPAPDTLWGEAQTQGNVAQGMLVIDDSTLDTPYAKTVAVVTRHWAGKHHAVVRGITLITLLWPAGDRHVPCDYRVFAKAQEHLTKTDHFQHMLTTAQVRGFQPACVVFASGYGGLENLKGIGSCQWFWLTRLQAHRQVNPDRQGLRPLSAGELGEQGRGVWLEGYGLMRVFKLVAPDGDIELGATNKVELTELERIKWANFAGPIEPDHRGVKQFCLLERAQVRSRRAGRKHSAFCLRACLRLDRPGYHHGLSWFAAKTAILREAVRQYIATPLYSLIPTA